MIGISSYNSGIKTTSGLKPKSMKTSDTMAWECKIFTLEFLGFKYELNMGIKLKILK